MKIINLIIFLIFTLTSTVIKANDLDFKNIKKSISNLESTIDFKNKSLPEYKVLTILDKLATKLNTSNIDKKILEDALTIITSLSIIEERFPKEVKISLDEEITKMRNTINSFENDIQILEKNKLQLENDLKGKVLLEEKITKLTQELLSSKDKIKTLSKTTTCLKINESEKFQTCFRTSKFFSIFSIEFRLSTKKTMRQIR